MSISSTLVQDAEIRFHEAHTSLRSLVGCFWVITAERGATIRVVPDGSTSISIQFQNRESSGWMLRGPLVRSDERRFSDPTVMIGVRLRPGVAFLVSGIASHALVGRRIALTGVPACCGLVSGESSLHTPAECIDALQAFLIERLANATVHPAVAAAMDHVERQHGCVRVGDIAAHCGVSVRHLNRLMRTWVGYGPKVFATIIRFQESLKHLERVPTQSGAALASNAGYFDQAHLTLDLRRFAGSTPGHLASRCVADFSKTYCDDRP